jgi:hypothetical protein
MKELLTLQGGYPREMDYLLNLQAELYTMSNGLFSGLGVDLVLSGCAVHDNGNGTVNIAPGLVYVAGEALRFDGANNVPADSSKALAKGAYMSSDQRTFGDGSLKNVYREAKAVVANAAGTLAEIKIKTMLYDLKQYIQDAVQSFEVKGTIKEIYDFDGTFPANFDASGLGVTPRWNGWHLFNANAGLTANPEGRTLITVGKFTDPVSGKEYEYANGDAGGEAEHKLLRAELPSYNVPLPNPSTKGRSDNANDRDVMIPTPNQNINVGGSDVPHNNMMPYMAVYRVIKIV